MTRLAWRRPMSTMLVALLVSSLAACESSESDSSQAQGGAGGVCRQTSLQNCGPGPWDPFGIALTFAWVGGQCTREVRCESQPVTSDLANGIVTDTFIASNWTSTRHQDVEPNDGIGEAMPMVLQANTSILLTGQVNDVDDPADFVALGVLSSQGQVAVYLCRAVNSCLLPFLQTDEIYIELMDQNGTVIATTNMMQTSNGHEIVFIPAQGLGYFIAVRANDTGGQNFDYQLNITD
jgi:hypothetical protein